MEGVTKSRFGRHVLVEGWFEQRVVDEWGGVPLMLTVGEGPRLPGRSHAHDLTQIHFAITRAREGLLASRLGNLRRLPTTALYAHVATGDAAQLIPRPVEYAMGVERSEGLHRFVTRMSVGGWGLFTKSNFQGPVLTRRRM